MYENSASSSRRATASKRQLDADLTVFIHECKILLDKSTNLVSRLAVTDSLVRYVLACSVSLETLVNEHAKLRKNATQDLKPSFESVATRQSSSFPSTDSKDLIRHQDRTINAISVDYESDVGADPIEYDSDVAEDAATNKRLAAFGDNKPLASLKVRINLQRAKRSAAARSKPSFPPQRGRKPKFPMSLAATQRAMQLSLAKKDKIIRENKVRKSVGARIIGDDAAETSGASAATKKKYKYYREFPPQQCAICALHIKGSWANLLNHIKRIHHSGKDKRPPRPKSFDCEVCGKKFNARSALALHGVKHVKMEFACDQCGATFNRQFKLNRHFVKGCNPPPLPIPPCRRPCLCAVCGRLQRDKGHLRDHLKRRHLPENRPFKCQICPASFKIKHDLTMHARRHTATKDFVCDECGFQCKLIDSLKQHQLTHAGLVFPCPVEGCTTKVNTKRHLQVHIRYTHDKLRNAACELCGKLFRGPSDLRRHMAFHGGPKDHICFICGHGVDRPNRLRLHMLRSHKIAYDGPMDQLNHVDFREPANEVASEPAYVALPETGESSNKIQANFERTSQLSRKTARSDHAAPSGTNQPSNQIARASANSRHVTSSETFQRIPNQVAGTSDIKRQGGDSTTCHANTFPADRFPAATSHNSGMEPVHRPVNPSAQYASEDFALPVASTSATNDLAFFAPSSNTSHVDYQYPSFLSQLWNQTML